MRRSERLFFIFIIVILIPSVVFAYKAYKSIAEKRAVYLLRERMEINDELSTISAKTEEVLAGREKLESSRRYYEYSYYFTPDALTSNDFVLQESPITKIPEDKLILGYFQIDDTKKLTTPYFFDERSVDENVTDIEYKTRFLEIVKAKAYPKLIEELEGVNPAPVKVMSQRGNVQSNFANAQAVFNRVNRDIDRNAPQEMESNQWMEEIGSDTVKYYPFKYLYSKGGVFAYRKVIAKKRTYLQGYVINTVHLTDEVLTSFIKTKAPSNFSIYSHPLEGKKYYLSQTLSNRLNFIKLYVYKNNNKYIDSVIREELIEYYLSAFMLFCIIIVGVTFIRRAIKSEAEINQKKGDFISAVTHELKTPLTSIRLYSEMLKDDMVPDEARKKVYYDYMLKESERLSRLINNVLDFSKIENNKKIYHMSRGDLKGMISELCEKYKSNLTVGGFELISEINDVTETVFDKDAMTQVFINLVDNAVKYSASSEHKTITVRLYDDNAKTIMEIEDKGIGIPKVEQKAIFEKFYRIENALTRTSKGSGIGLSIVKEYVKAHGGSVEAFSKDNSGARFRVSLPKKAGRTE